MKKSVSFLLAALLVVGAFALLSGIPAFAALDSAPSGSRSGALAAAVNVPPTPTGLRVTGKTRTSITYAWNKVSGTVSSYRLTVNRVAYFDKGYLTKTITNLVPNTKYTAVVAACNASGCSANFLPVVTYTLP